MYKLFIVDDEYMIREGMRYLIDWAYYNIEIVGEACDGEDAYQKLQEIDVDIVLTDISMPNLDGLGLISKLKKDQRNIKYIILSGYKEFSYIKEGLQLGIENYLLKPVSVKELEQTIEQSTTLLDEQYQAIEETFVFKEHILSRLIQEEISTRDVKERLSFLDVHLQPGDYEVWKYTIDFGENMEREKRSLMRCIGKKYELAFFDHSHKLWLILGNETLANIDEIEVDIAQKIGDTIQNQDFTLEKGERVNSYEKIAQSAKSIQSENMQDAHQSYYLTHLLQQQQRDSKISPIVVHCLNIIADQYHKDLSLKQLGIEMNINVAYLGQIFQKETGRTFSDYVNGIRVSHAMRRLSETLERVNDISISVGYGNVAYFHRIFKKYVHMSPAEFRQHSHEERLKNK
ncbi:MAG: response regulator transcription factor [Bacilli bacterium]